MRVDMNDVDRLCVLNMGIAICMIFLGLFADFIFSWFQMGFNVGIGSAQVAWVLFWVAYIGYNSYYMKYLGRS